MIARRIGSYEPLMELASGGMGVVYVARKVGDAGFERLVVLKRVHRHLLLEPDFRKIIRDEARVLSLVHDAHVASVIDVVESDGELSLILEYIESMSLAALLASAKERGERLPVPVAARIVSDALAGLYGAHTATSAEGEPLGLIHRDVSPQNVIVGTDGTSRLIDFGIAKTSASFTDPGRNEGTQSGILKGKLRYMSPEQVKRFPLDRRSDIYSAGVVLYEVLTGERVFRTDDEADLLLNLLLGDVRRPTEWVPDLPPALDAVVLRALARDREERFETAAEFAEAIERAVPIAPTRDVARFVQEHGGKILTARRARVREAARVASASSDRAIPSSTGSRRPDLRRARWIGVSALVALAMGLAALASQRRARPPVEVAAPALPVGERPSGDDATPSSPSPPASPASVPHPLPPRAPRATPELHRNPYGYP